MTELIARFVDIMLHLDVHLSSTISEYGTWTYLILFLIVFCETGLVVTPFLPGDSLLFAAGAFAGKGSLELMLLIPLLCVAGILGDAVNYAIGRYLGPKVLKGESWFLKKEYLIKTQAFYERYGGKTIVIARFVPIIRTFAPFLAGVGKMNYSRFGLFNISGAILWVVLFCAAGYWFGNIPLVRKNFTLVILAIIVISVLPAVFEALRAKKTPVKHLV
ncbi:MAG: DedA family protein [Pseudomonadota bacterium]